MDALRLVAGRPTKCLELSRAVNPPRMRFNAFQRAMLQWNSMHPYNAVHVVRLPGSPFEERLKDAINRAIEARGLTALTLNRERGTYTYAGGPSDCELVTIECEENLTEVLSREIERQLNTPFPNFGAFIPFRLFVARGEDSFALGLVYLHAVADAESIVLLMKEIVAYYAGRRRNGQCLESRIPSAVHRNQFLAHPGAFTRKLASMPTLIKNMRRSCRPSYGDAANFHNGFRLIAMESRNLRCLVESAKAWGITVNDLLLASLTKSCAILATGREQARRRKNLSVGCIVNTRRDFGEEDRKAFGLFLGSFVITHAVPNHVTLRELAGDIGRKTLEIKKKKLYLAAALELSFGRLMLSFFSVERMKKLYQKNYPLWGGLSNMNINSLWRSVETDKPIDYVRAVSTGPVTPLVLSFSTIGNVANIGLSYRSTVFSTSDIGHFVSRFLEALTSLEVCT